jgi:hypothetical protein
MDKRSEINQLPRVKRAFYPQKIFFALCSLDLLHGEVR